MQDTKVWDDVRVFLALRRSRTVGEASARLDVDASTVSRRLAALEAELGVRLFERGRSGLTATEAADELMPVAEQIEEAMLRFSTAASTLERSVEGEVRVSCPPDLAEVVIAPLLLGLFARHPQLRIDVTPSETLVDLTRREADLALRTVMPVAGDLVVTRLTDVPWVLAASTRVARAVGVLGTWEQATWIGPGERLGRSPPGQWFHAHVQGVHPRFRSDSLRMQIAAVENDVGIALLPAGSVAHYGLAQVRVGKQLRAAVARLPSSSLFLVTHRASRTVPRIRVVHDLLVERLRAKR